MCRRGPGMGRRHPHQRLPLSNGHRTRLGVAWPPRLLLCGYVGNHPVKPNNCRQTGGVLEPGIVVPPTVQYPISVEAQPRIFSQNSGHFLAQGYVEAF